MNASGRRRQYTKRRPPPQQQLSPVAPRHHHAESTTGGGLAQSQQVTSINLNTALPVPMRLRPPPNYNALPRTDPDSAGVAAPSSPTSKAQKWMNRLKGPNRAYKEALPSVADYKMLSRSSRRSGNMQKELLSWFNQAVLFDNALDWASAAKCYAKLLELAQQLSDVAAACLAYNGLAVSHHYLGDFKRAVHYNKKHRHASPDGVGRIIALCNEGLAHRAAGNLDLAQQYHERALAEAIQTEDEGGESLACGQLGMDVLRKRAVSRGTHRRVGQNLSRHADLCMKSKDPRAVGLAYQQQGMLANARGSFEEAFAYFEKARDLALLAGDQAMSNLDKCHIGIARGNQRLKEYLKDINASVGQQGGAASAFSANRNG